MEVNLANELKKAPTQKRAHTLFDSVLEATNQLLPNLGYFSTTTNKIAERAGVSIGSLYQYFKNKDSICLSLFGKIINQNNDRFKIILQEREAKTLNEKIEVIVTHVVDMFMERKRILDILFTFAPRFETSTMIVRSRQRAARDLVEVLKDHEDELAVSDLKAACEVTVNMVMGVIHGHILDKSSTLNRQMLIQELSVLTKNYLCKPTTTQLTKKNLEKEIS